MKRQDALKPVKEYRVYGHKPVHLELPGSVYFVTYDLIAGQVLSERAKDIVLQSIKFHAGRKYTLFACVVMDTHSHVIFQPLERPDHTFWSLAQIAHSIKSYSANRIQRTLGAPGRIWKEQGYDRMVRDEKALLAEMEYIVGNPVRAGLVTRPQDYRWLYAAGF
jgi:REP element-mobilizing transposase RayT